MKINTWQNMSYPIPPTPAKNYALACIQPTKLLYLYSSIGKLTAITLCTPEPIAINDL